MKAPWHYHSTVVIDEKYLYVFGGRDSTNEQPLGTIEMLNLDKSELHWVSLEIVNKAQDWTPWETTGCFAIN